MSIASDSVYSNESNTEEWTPPAFQDEWEKEFKESSFNPRKMQLVCLISLLYYYGNSFGTVFWRQKDDVGGGWYWLFVTWLPEMVCATQHGLWMLLLESQQLRPFCIRAYNAVCTYIIVCSYAATIVPSFLWEYRLAKFHALETSALKLDLALGGSFPPNRTCIHLNTTITGSETEFVASCNTSVLSGTVYIGYIFWNLLPRVCRIKPRYAAFVAVSTAVMLLIFSMAIGADAWSIITCVVFQLAAGAGTVFFCAVGDRLAREKFALLKATQFAGVQNRDLLHTLIPPNVVARMTGFKGEREMLGREIEHCIVMFCSLEPHADLRATEVALTLLDTVFSAFDEAVQRFGMFKYQHVGDWYIVACPRAACPFDSTEQEGPASRHAQSMVGLGHELQAIASQYSNAGASLWLRVGISCGPVAGAVIGSLRAFYCLYGDTVNTAARMCKYAGPGAIHCTESMAALVSPRQVTIKDRGVSEIKGKGAMHTYDLVALAGTRVETAAADLVVITIDRRRPSRPTDLRQIVQATAGSEHAEGWLSDPARRISRFLSTFVDPSLEEQFQTLVADGQRRLLTAGMLLHALSIPMQWRLAGAGQNPPPDTQAFARLRSEEDIATVRNMLTLHWVASWIVTALLVGALWYDVRHVQRSGQAFIALLIVHMAVQGAASTLMVIGGDPWSWALTLGTGACLISGWLGPLSVRGAIVLGFTASAGYYAALPPRAAYATEAALILALSVGVVLLVWTNNHGQRMRFLLRELCRAQLHRLRGILYDLLPPTIARTILRISGRPPPETYRAAVLQLDICKFTVMSQTMPPMQLANMIHTVFSRFDVTVERHKLFKMDTVGDAYIIAGLLTEDTADKTCRGLLAVAETMIHTLEQYRADTGRDVHCRIGVAVGTVVAGVLGKLQPRFHIQGAGVQAAEVTLSLFASSRPVSNAARRSWSNRARSRTPCTPARRSSVPGATPSISCPMDGSCTRPTKRATCAYGCTVRTRRRRASSSGPRDRRHVIAVSEE